MKKWWFFLFFILGIGSIGYVIYPRFKQERPPAKREIEKHLKETYGPYFFSLPILKYSAANIPYFSINIEERDILVELDLGFRGGLTLEKTIIERIKEKTFFGKKTMYGIRGKGYVKKKYRAPKIHINNIVFSNSIIYEESETFNQDSIILTNQNSTPALTYGRIGWELFQKCNLFLDLANDHIAFCDSIQTLERHGYPSNEFIKTTLFVERGFVEIEANGPNGLQVWALDTGSTWNIVNTNEAYRSIEEMASDTNNELECSFAIEGKTLGPMVFHKLPIKLPIQVEGMLGMEFFKAHQVFIDFAEHQIYIRKVY